MRNQEYDQLTDCILTPSYLVLYTPRARHTSDEKTESTESEISKYVQNLKCDGSPISQNEIEITKQKLPESNKNRGEISADQSARIRYAVRLMYWSSKWKSGYDKKTKKNFKWRLNMLTLTLSDQQKHSDKWIRKHMLEPFLRILRNYFGVKKYVWKAEIQVRGVIHFHVTTDQFIPWQSIREEWNRIQFINGYLSDFEKKHHHTNPNSTDVKAIKNDRQLSDYLGKYIAKKEMTEDEESKMMIDFRVGCKLWDSSNNLKVRKCKLEAIENLHSDELRRAIEGGQKFVGDFTTMIPIRINKFPRLRKHFRNYLIHHELIPPNLLDGSVFEFER